MKIEKLSKEQKDKFVLTTIQRPNGFIEILSGMYVINRCEPMERIYVKFKDSDEIHIACENHHPELPVLFNAFLSLVLGKGSMFKIEKL